MIVPVPVLCLVVPRPVCQSCFLCSVVHVALSQYFYYYFIIVVIIINVFSAYHICDEVEQFLWKDYLERLKIGRIMLKS